LEVKLWWCEGFVGLVVLAGLEAEVELAEHPVEQVAQRGGVPVAVVAAVSVVAVGVFVVGQGGEGPGPAGRGEAVVLDPAVGDRD
jgi:uncharacterized membrane protein